MLTERQPHAAIVLPLESADAFQGGEEQMALTHADAPSEPARVEPQDKCG